MANNMKKLLVILIVTLIANTTAFSAEPYVPPADAKLEYNQGIDLYKLGQYDRAMASFRHAIDLDPNYIDAYFNLGAVLEYLNQDDAALSVFKQIIVRKPDDYEALYKAAALSVKLNQPGKAKEYLSLIPPSSTVYLQAQSLAQSSLKADMQTIKQQTQQAVTTQKFTQNQDVFNNIASPTGIAADSLGNVYIASFSDNTIYKVTTDGRRQIFLKDARISGPIGMVRDGSGYLYVANYNASNVLKISPSGVISVIVQSISKPYGLHLAGGILFISSQGTNSIVRYSLK
jgi:tetratricopeptide (TPR) repeat protein